MIQKIPLSEIHQQDAGLIFAKESMNFKEIKEIMSL
jgi:hypothetical protein